MFNLDNTEQSELRAAISRVACKAIPSFQTTEFYNTTPRKLLSTFAELGITGLAIPEEFGGISADAWTCAITMEELAAVDLGPAIFISVHTMVSGLINRFGNQAQKNDYLRKLATGQYLGAYALTEPGAGSDAAALKTSATASGDNFILNGTKCYITSAGWADVYIVFAKTTPNLGKAGISAFLVEANTPGLIISAPEKKMGCELSPIASLTFDHMAIHQSQLLGELNQGYAIALNGLAGGRVNIAACANGLSKTAIEIAKKHLASREQFGCKLIEMQGLQFILADLAIKHAAARLLTWKAADEISRDSKSQAARVGSSMAKCFATDSAMTITTDAVQLLGGAGYIKDYQVERLMRDAKMLQIVEGANQIQRLVIAREMQKEL